MSYDSDPYADYSAPVGSFAKFQNPGDSVAGTIKAVERGTDLQGNPVPQWRIVQADGTEIAVTCSQYELLTWALENKPPAGSGISITLSQLEPIGDGKTVKRFDIVTNPPAVAPDASHAPAAAPAPAPAPEGAPAVPAQQSVI